MKLMRCLLWPMLGFVLFLGTGGAAYGFGLTECAPSRKGSDLGCTANDVSITGIALAPGGPTACVGGTSLLVDLDVTVNFATPNRWDIGIFLVNDGKDPQALPANGGSASCSVGILPLTVPFLNLDSNGGTDTCGDGNGSINGNTGSGVLRMSGVPISCQAVNLSGGNLYIPFVVSWDNQASPSGSTCTSVADPVPNTTSKCNSPKTTVAAEVAYGTVNAVVLPAITKTDGIASIEAGNSTTYSVVITNTTGVSLSNAVFTDPAVANLNVTGVSCSAAAGATCPAPASVTVAAMQGAGITIPAMPVNGSVTFTLNATVSASAPAGALTNTARVTAGPLGPTPPANRQTNTASDTNTVVRKPTIRVVKQTLGGTGSFSFSGSNGIGNFSLDTAGANPQTSATFALTTAGSATTLSETIPAGWSLDGAACTDGATTFGNLSGATLTIPGANLGYNQEVVCTFTNTRLLPSLTFLKTSLVERDPLNLTSNPKAIPGADVLYNLQVANFGPGSVDAGSLLITDPIPANTRLFVGDLGQGGPVVFTDGDADSGFPGPPPLPFSLSYSSRGDCGTFNYTPLADTDGFDGNVCRLRIQMNGAMNGAVVPTTPDFHLLFRVRID